MVDPKERMFCQVDGLEDEGLIYKHGHVCLISMHILYTILYIVGLHQNEYCSALRSSTSPRLADKSRCLLAAHLQA